MAGEGDTERACRAVANTQRNVFDAALVTAKEVFRERHPPSEQIIHGCNTNRAAEAFKES
jgi:hypothetical protein